MKKFLSALLICLFASIVLSGCGSSKKTENFAFTSEDVVIPNEGRNIPATIVIPEGKDRYPLVVMSHGFAGSRQEGNGFRIIAETLAKNGIATIRLDFAGCGDSEKEFTEYNLTNNLSDVEACIAYAKDNERIDPDKTALLGYSMGGRISLLLNESHKGEIKALGLLAPAAFTKSNPEYENAQKDLESASASGYNTIEWFGNELKVGLKHYEDYLASFETIENLEKTCDTLIIYGTNDVMVAPDVSKALGKKLDAEIFEIEGADHGYGFYEEGSETPQKIADKFAAFYKKAFEA